MININVEINNNEIYDLIRVLKIIEEGSFDCNIFDPEGDIFVLRDEKGSFCLKDYKGDKAVLENFSFVDCVELNGQEISISEMAKLIIKGKKEGMDLLKNYMNDVDMLYEICDLAKDNMKYRDKFNDLIGWYTKEPESPNEYINFLKKAYEIGKNNS